ncbi:MAG: KamA family radical SAM protein [Planctomycetes bacterium]|nr:KamA family radical SAM protein [Planctomycetota bacterium]MCA8937099.1 KamA family radical SAM protein [Planctomycetota bacterium]
MDKQTSVIEEPTVGDLPEISDIPELAKLADVVVPEPIKEEVPHSELEHRDFDDREVWRRIPAFKDVDYEQFIDFKFQLINSVTSPEKLTEIVGELASQEFVNDMEAGLRAAPMNVRVSPYLISRIDWDNPYDDPIRIQFLPVASRRKPDHPQLTLDSLHEQDDSPTPGLVHRYPDKVLFLPLDVCPVYCRFCTRSYAIGGDTNQVEKVGYKYSPERWKKAFAYIASRPEIEDVVVSGGDAWNLAPMHLKEILSTLLAIPHIRRIRLATKGPAVMPMKIQTDRKWFRTLLKWVDHGRKLGKEVCLHTHFNSPNEISLITYDAMQELFRHGIKVRNQSVLIRGVNDTPEKMQLLVKRLSYMNVQPYYVYQHDMVKGVEELRTRVGKTVELERHVRGATAGFNTPIFVNDVPGGGGKRDVHSYDYYNETTGVSVYRSPNVDEEKAYLYYDPIDQLPEEGQQRWGDESEHQAIIDEALKGAGLSDLEPAR